MSENEISEVPSTPESIHIDFMDKQKASLKERLTNVLGKSAIGLGVVFSGVAIGDFVSGGKVSEAIALTGLPLAENLANMSLITKACGGSSLIASGSFLERLGQS